MYYKSKKISLFILLVTALICSGVITFLFDDQINRTFIIALTLGILIYFFSLAAYLFDNSTNPADLTNQYDPTGIGILQQLSFVHFSGFKRILFAVAVQIILAAGFFFFWN